MRSPDGCLRVITIKDISQELSTLKDDLYHYNSKTKELILRVKTGEKGWKNPGQFAIKIV